MVNSKHCSQSCWTRARRSLTNGGEGRVGARRGAGLGSNLRPLQAAPPGPLVHREGRAGGAAQGVEDLSSNPQDRQKKEPEQTGSSIIHRPGLTTALFTCHAPSEKFK